MIGNHKNPEHFMQAADAFLFPSKSEGLGSVVLEALMCGLPVIANPLKGITDNAIDHGSNGFSDPFPRRQGDWSDPEGESLFHGTTAKDSGGGRKKIRAGRIDEQYHYHLKAMCHGR